MEETLRHQPDHIDVLGELMAGAQRRGDAARGWAVKARLALAALALAGVARADDARVAPPLEEATIAQLQAAMQAGQLTARRLVEQYLDRIDRLDRRGPTLHQVLETNPEATAIADALDAERRTRGPRGPSSAAGDARCPSIHKTAGVVATSRRARTRSGAERRC